MCVFQCDVPEGSDTDLDSSVPSEPEVQAWPLRPVPQAHPTSDGASDRDPLPVVLAPPYSEYLWDCMYPQFSQGR